MANSRYVKGDYSGGYAKASQSKYLDMKACHRKALAAGKYNKAISDPAVALSKTGRIKNEKDFNRIALN